MHIFVLSLHNATRWLILLVGLWTLGRMIGGRRSGRAWTPRDRLSTRAFAWVTTYQFVLGAFLYGMPDWFVQATWRNVDLATIMDTRGLRFFVIEHPLQMIIAIGCAHLASYLSKRAPTDHQRFKRGAIWLGVALLLIVIAIPWPFLPAGRPWLR